MVGGEESGEIQKGGVDPESEITKGEEHIHNYEPNVTIFNFRSFFTIHSKNWRFQVHNRIPNPIFAEVHSDPTLLIRPPIVPPVRQSLCMLLASGHSLV